MIRLPRPATTFATRIGAGALAIALTTLGCHSSLLPGKSKWDFDKVEPASFNEPLPPPVPGPDEFIGPPPLPSDAGPALTPDDAEPIRFGSIRRLEELRPDQLRPMELDHLLHIALENNAVVRDDRQFLAQPNGALANPEFAASAFDTSIQATSAGGEAAALAAFDLQMSAGSQWGQNSLTRSNGFLTGSIPGTDILVSESGSLYGRLDKPLAAGGVASLVHAWNYVPNSLPAQAFNSRYAGYLRTEWRQPLLAGFGRDFTQVAGPINSINPNPGVGVAIARLDQNISVAEFESRIALLLKQTHDLYWDLWLAHEAYRTQLAALASAEELCHRVQGRADAGLDGGEAANRAYAEENLYQWQSAVEGALSMVLETENRLRRLTGLAASDGQLIVPATPPHLAPMIPEWHAALAAAVCNRLELRQQRLRIQSLSMQTSAAGSLTRPQLDVVAGAQLNGTGDGLIDGNSSAVDQLVDADKAGWNVGFEFSMPLGFHLANSRVRNLEFRLAKARAALHAQESEVSHELTHAIHELDRTFAAVGAAAARRDAARRRYEAVAADYEAGRSSLDLLLRTRVSVAEAERSYSASIVAYNKALIDLAYREGLLLRENAIVLADDDAQRAL
jgi:outer membrane protein TolC